MQNNFFFQVPLRTNWAFSSGSWKKGGSNPSTYTHRAYSECWRSNFNLLKLCDWKYFRSWTRILQLEEILETIQPIFPMCSVESRAAEQGPQGQAWEGMKDGGSKLGRVGSHRCFSQSGLDLIWCIHWASSLRSFYPQFALSEKSQLVSYGLLLTMNCLTLCILPFDLTVRLFAFVSFSPTFKGHLFQIVALFSNPGWKGHSQVHLITGSH